MEVKEDGSVYKYVLNHRHITPVQSLPEINRFLGENNAITQLILERNSKQGTSNSPCAETENPQIKNRRLIWGGELELLQNRDRRQRTLLEFHYHQNWKILEILEKDNSKMSWLSRKK